jgi:hypothetical protein
VAHFLRELGVGYEALVAISLERSPEMVVGLLGIPKGGLSLCTARSELSDGTAGVHVGGHRGASIVNGLGVARKITGNEREGGLSGQRLGKH